MALIFWFSSMSDPTFVPDPLLDVVLKKLAHAGAYFILALLVGAAAKPRTGGSAALVAFTVAALYAVTDEVHQAFVGGRNASVLDALIDWAGAATGALLLALRFTRTNFR